MMMLTIRSVLFVLLVNSTVYALPQQRNRNGNGNGGGNGNTQAQTPQQQAAAIPQGISEATDGSTILDTTATVKWVPTSSSIPPLQEKLITK
jgi:hypothetical protein